MWNPWSHLRVAGALTLLVGSFMHNTLLFGIGLLIQYVGILGSCNLTERRLDALESAKGEDDAVR